MEKKNVVADPAPLAFKILVFLEKVPKYLKEGPWSPVAHLILIGFFGYILITFEHAAASYGQLFDVHSVHYMQNREIQGASKNWIQYYRIIGGCYMLCITGVVLYTSGAWPLASYTLTSWNLTSIRLLTSFVGAMNLGISPYFQSIADIVRFPALVGCSITVAVWWIVLVPVISFYMPDATARKKFGIFNRSFPLLNLHLFNLPLCAIEFMSCARCLTFFDLWVALAVAFVYMMFYLNVLDRLGLHFYIVFTPRTVYCVVPYAMILLFYWGLYHGWNHVLSYTYEMPCF